MKMDVLTATNGDALKCVIKKDNGFVNVKNPVPVSYTHLDVYKRQALPVPY